MKTDNGFRIVCTFAALGIIFLGAASYVVRIGARTVISATGKTNAFTAWLFKDQPTLNNEAEKTRELRLPVIYDWASMYPFSDESLRKAEAITQAAARAESAEAAAAERSAKSAGARNDAAPAPLLAASGAESSAKKVWALPSYDLPGKFRLERWYNRFFRKEMFSQAMQFIEDKFKWNLMPPGGKSDIVTGAIKLGNKHLCVLCSRGSMAVAAESIKSFAAFLKAQDTPFVYVMAPSVIAPDEKYVSGHWDFSNQNADELLGRLESAGVATLDLRPLLTQDGIAYADAFFVTDHHWLPDTGVWATGKLAAWLNQNAGFACDTSLYKSENYSRKVYPKWFLGSYGRKATLARTTLDDVPILFPKKEVRFHYVNPAAPCERTGGFDVIYHYERLELAESHAPDSVSVYLGNKYAAFIDNLDENASGKVLLVGDSYFLMLAPFLAQSVKRVEYLSLDYFSGSLERYIQDNGPYDACVVMFYTGDLQDKVDFSTHQDQFDFR